MDSYYLFALLLTCLFRPALAASGSDNLLESNPKASWDNDLRDDSSWTEYDTKLYAKGGQVLDPKETLDILRILEEKLKGSIRKYKDVYALLNIADVSRTNCEELPKILDLIDLKRHENLDYQNIVAFLDKQKIDHYLNCQQSLHENSQQISKILPDLIGQNFERLKESMVEVMPIIQDQVFRTSYRELLAEGAANFLKNQPVPAKELFRSRESRENLYKQKFDELVNEPCKKFLEIGRDTYKVFRSLSKDKRILKSFDPFVRKWLENYNLCYSISDNQREADLIRASSTSLLMSISEHAH